MSAAGPAPARWGMRGLGALIRSEGRLFLRDPGNLFFVIAFPTVLLVGLGLTIPGMRVPILELPAPWRGFTPIDFFTPVMLATVAATAGLTALPAYVAGARELGVVRRLQTTPMRRQGVLVAPVVVQLCGVAVGAVLALVVAVTVFDCPMPRQPALAIVAFLLAVASMFAVGLVIGGLAPRASTASGLGTLLYFPMLFVAGVWTPGPLMPDAVAQVAQWTPLGAAAQALMTAWFEQGTPWLALGVAAAWSVLAFTVAVRTFRWTR